MTGEGSFRSRRLGADLIALYPKKKLARSGQVDARLRAVQRLAFSSLILCIRANLRTKTQATATQLSAQGRPRPPGAPPRQAREAGHPPLSPRRHGPGLYEDGAIVRPESGTTAPVARRDELPSWITRMLVSSRWLLHWLERCLILCELCVA